MAYHFPKPPKPGDGNIVIGRSETAGFVNKRAYSLSIANIIEGDFWKKWVLVKDDLKVRRDAEIKRDLEVQRDLKVKGRLSAPLVLASVAVPSDQRSKKVLGSLQPQESLEKLRSLKAMRYFYKKGADLPEGEQIGFIAQEVQKVLPRLIRKTGEEGMLAVNYTGIIPVVVEAVKSLDSRNKHLKREQSRLERENRELKERLAAIEEALQKLAD